MSLLRSDEPAPYVLLAGSANHPLALICDHAGRRIPAVLGNLGLSQPDLSRHIAWDIGASVLTKTLAERLDCPAVLQTYSRLVVDCNRDPTSVDSMPEQVDGSAIAGNVGLSGQERRARITEIFERYHHAVEVTLKARGQSALPVFLHSFTPRFDGEERPWSVGILHDDSPTAQTALAYLREALGADRVGDNEPYRFDPTTDYSARRHALLEGRPFLEIEVRQDLLQVDGGIDRMAKLLSAMLRRII